MQEQEHQLSRAFVKIKPFKQAAVCKQKSTWWHQLGSVAQTCWQLGASLVHSDQELAYQSTEATTLPSEVVTEHGTAVLDDGTSDVLQQMLADQAHECAILRRKCKRHAFARQVSPSCLA